MTEVTDITIDCEVSIPTAPIIGQVDGIMADDLCDEEATDLVLEETSTQGTDNTDCTFYNYAITRIWTATDDCNNTFQTTQVITVQDTTRPEVPCSPEDLTYDYKRF